MKLYSMDYIKSVKASTAEEEFIRYINSFNQEYQLDCIKINPQIILLIKNRDKGFIDKAIEVQPLLHRKKVKSENSTSEDYVNKIIYDKKVNIIIDKKYSDHKCPLHQNQLEKVNMKVVMQNISKNLIYKGGFCKHCNSFYITQYEYLEQSEELKRRPMQVNIIDKTRQPGVSIEEILERRKIKYLVHFTRLENLDSIITHGLISRRELDKSSIDYVFNDENRYDGKKDCICFTVEYPNYYNLNKFKRNFSDAKWSIIILDAKLLYKSNNYYAFYNAASNCVHSVIQNLTHPKDFEAMFNNYLHINLTKEEREYHRDKIHNMHSFLTTSEQAEILIKDKVDKAYIRKIYFSCESDKAEYISNSKNHGQLENIELEVNKDIFYRQREYYNFERR